MVPVVFIGPCTFEEAVPSLDSFGKGRLSLTGRGMLECSMTLSLVMQATKCKFVWWHHIWGIVICLQLRLLRSIAPTNMWYFLSTVQFLSRISKSNG